MRLATKLCNKQTSSRPGTRSAARCRPCRAVSSLLSRVTNLIRIVLTAVISQVRSKPANDPAQEQRNPAATPWRSILVALLALLLHESALATGTNAGTDISNTATAGYVIGGTAGTTTSTVTLRVDEKLDVNVAWQDVANVGVSTPDTNRVLTFLLTNTGNGNDSYALGVQNGLGGDQFDPVFVDIYLDANANAVFNPGVDVLYIAGTNDPLLGADAAQTIFVRNNVPGGLNNGDIGNSELVATSNTGSGLPGTSFANAGDNNTTAVVGTSGGTANATGAYQVTSTNVALLKSVVITDPLGGNQPVTGATMTYSIDATVTGTGTATGVVLTDPLPANTTYSAGTLNLNTAALTDGLDADAGDVGGTAANTVTVNLGDLTPASPVQTITFEVVIN